MTDKEISKRFEQISDLLYDLAGEISDKNPDLENLPDHILFEIGLMHDDLMTISSNLNFYHLRFQQFGNWEGKVK